MRVTPVELFKLRRRSATWTLGITWLMLGVFFGYLLPYLLYRSQRGEPTPFSIPLANMLPAATVENAIQGFPLFGLALALVIGAFAVGSEYDWGTWTSILSKNPNRFRVLGGKLAAVAIIVLALTVASFGLAAAGGAVVALAEGAESRWPDPVTVVRGLAAGWLILATGAAIGVAGAIVLRGATIVVGLGVLYVSALETLIGAFAGQSETLRTIAKVLPGTNAGSLAAGFVPYVQAGGTAAPGMVSIVAPIQAALVLLFYTAGLVGLALLIFSRRDIVAPG
jgi:ABC-2 type transport system permease protein